MKSAYIWTREHSPERLRLIDDLRRTWTYLFGENPKRGHYAGIQWRAKPHCDWSGAGQFECMLDGRSVTVHMFTVTARAWYARELYRRALAITRARYPDLEAHRFVDGDRIGERRIEFLNERHALSYGHIFTALWRTAKDDNPVVREACLLEPCSQWGTPAGAEERWEKPQPDHIRATVILNVREAKDDDAAHVIASMKAGLTPDLSSDPISLSFDDVREGFVELSHPELVLLNWEDAFPALTESDEALWTAAYKLEPDGIKRAIAEGANVNSMRTGEDNLLSEIITGWRDHHFNSNANEEDRRIRENPIGPDREVSRDEMLAMLRCLLDAGAHPDAHNFGGVPAIVSAALAQDRAITALLLDYGADTSIRPYWDDGATQWPSAWDYAYTDGFHIDCDPGAREVYYEMIKRRSSPHFEQEYEDKERLGEAAIPDDLRDRNPEPESDSQPVIPNVDIERPLTELAAATAFARAWNRLDPEPFLGLLAPDAHYASQWVFEELKSRQAIADYLRGKMKTVRNHGANDPNQRVRAELTTCRNGQDCVAMIQGEHNEVDAVVVFSIADDAIVRYDMCVPGLMGPVRSGVFPI